MAETFAKMIINIAPEMKDEVKYYSWKNRITMTDFVRQAIAQKLEQEKQQS